MRAAWRTPSGTEFTPFRVCPPTLVRLPRGFRPCKMKSGGRIVPYTLSSLFFTNSVHSRLTFFSRVWNLEIWHFRGGRGGRGLTVKKRRNDTGKSCVNEDGAVFQRKAVAFYIRVTPRLRQRWSLQLHSYSSISAASPAVDERFSSTL